MIFAERINPSKLNFSPKMAAIVGAIIGHDYGVRVGRAGQLRTPFSVTSDGYVVASCTGHESGAFLGDIADFERNIKMFREELSDDDRVEFDTHYATAVVDWRSHVHASSN